MSDGEAGQRERPLGSEASTDSLETKGRTSKDSLIDWDEGLKEAVVRETGLRRRYRGSNGNMKEFIDNGVLTGSKQNQLCTTSSLVAAPNC